MTGRSAVKSITLFDTSRHRSKIAGEITDFDLHDFLRPKTGVRHLARHSQFALAAAKLALDDAGLDAAGLADDVPLPIFIGVSTSAMEVVEMTSDRIRKDGPHGVPIVGVNGSQPHQAAAEIAHELGLPSDIHSLCSACAAGLDAVVEAAAVVRSGKADIAIAGGTDAPITALTFAGLDNAGLVSRHNDAPHRASRPFDHDADTGCVSEGSGIIVLENLEHAMARGAKIYGGIAGAGSAADCASNLLSGLFRSMEIAIDNAGLRPDDIDYICAHGPGNPAIDRAETDMIKRLFGDHAYQVPVSSIKGVIGNPLSAAGPMQLIACVQTLAHDVVPPTANHERPANGCDLDYVAGTPRMCRANHILANVHSLGGSNTSVVLDRIRPG